MHTIPTCLHRSRLRFSICFFSSSHDILRRVRTTTTTMKKKHFFIHFHYFVSVKSDRIDQNHNFFFLVHSYKIIRTFCYGLRISIALLSFDRIDEKCNIYYTHTPIVFLKCFLLQINILLLTCEILLILLYVDGVLIVHFIE